MRREMTEQIEELRLKGLGYKSIALVVGTSRENVRYYCKTHDLSGDPKEVQAKLADAKKNKNKPERCKNCGKRLVRNSHSGKKLFVEMHAVEIGGKIIKKNQEEAQAHFMFLNAHIVESDSLPMVISLENIVATTVI